MVVCRGKAGMPKWEAGSSLYDYQYETGKQSEDVIGSTGSTTRNEQ
jgi:hypothetical protein